MDPRRGPGRALLTLCTASFGLGVLVSALSPNWIVVAPLEGSAFEEVAWGPFYGYYRTCARDWDGDGVADCTVALKGLDASDCRAAGDGVSDAFCNRLVASRSLAIVCFFLLMAGGVSQAKNNAVTNGCDTMTCGASGRFSHKRIGAAIWCLEVGVSVASWCLALSSLGVLRRGSDVVGAARAVWPLWLFVASATGMGSFAALATDWAARREETDDGGDLDEPLVGA